MPRRDLFPGGLRSRIPGRLRGVPTELVALLAVATGLRLYRIGAESLWLDEAYSVVVAHTHAVWWLLFELPTQDPHPPLHYLFLNGWIVLFGTSEVAVRTPEAIFGVAGVAIIYLLGRSMYDRTVGTIAGLLATVSPFLVWHAQDARMYSLLFLLSGLSILLLVALTERVTAPRALAYVVATALLGYTHVYGLLVILAQGLFLVTRPLLPGSRLALDRREPFALLGGVAILLSPWLFRLASDLGGELATISWIPRPTPETVLRIFRTFVVGDSVHWRLEGAVPRWLAALVGILSIVCVLLAGLRVSEGRSNADGPGKTDDDPSAFVWGVEKDPEPHWDREDGSGSTSGSGGQLAGIRVDREDLPAAWLLLLVLLVPVVVPYLVSVTWAPVLVERYAIPAVLGFLLLVARGASAVRPPPARVLVVGLLLAGLVVPLPAYYGSDQKEQWDEAAAYVDARADGDDLVLVLPSYTWRAFGYYFDGPATVRRGDRWTDAATLRAKLRGFDEVFLVMRNPDEATVATVRRALANRSYTDVSVDREFLGIDVGHYRPADGDG